MFRFAYKRAYEAANYRLRSFGGGRLAGFCRPVSIVFCLTERCNSRCVHCDIWKKRGPEDPPTMERLKATLVDLRRWLGPVQVTFSGGEALLKPYTVDLVAFASSLGLFVEVLTHGYWKDQSRIEALALASPWRVTVSFDGFGDAHNKVRGREDFFRYTEKTIETLRRLRYEKKLKYEILLMTVIMEHNLEEVAAIANFARMAGIGVFYQPIEANYGTEEDSTWYERSENWPKDSWKAIREVNQLDWLKRHGRPIRNSFDQLEVMKQYFGNPAAIAQRVQNHTAHENQPVCSVLTNLQIQANGDVLVCPNISAVGNIKKNSIREIWNGRPKTWERGCCLHRG